MASIWTSVWTSSWITCHNGIGKYISGATSSDPMTCWWHEIMDFWDCSYKDGTYRSVGLPFLCYKRMPDTRTTSWMLWEDEVNNVGDLCSHAVVLLSAPTHTSPSCHWSSDGHQPLTAGWAFSCLCIITLWLISEPCEHSHPFLFSKSLSKLTISLSSEWLQHNILKEVRGIHEMVSDVHDRLFPQLSLR